MSQDTQKLASAGTLALVGRVAGRGIHMLVQVVLARLLGPAQFGLYALGFAVFRLLGLLSPLGMDHGVIRFGSRWDGEDRPRFKGVVAQSVLTAILAGLTLASAVYLLAPWLATTVFGKPALTPVLRLFSLALVFQAALRVLCAATRISHRVQFAVVAEEILQPSATLLLAVVFIGLGWGLTGAVSATVLATGVAAALAGRFLWSLFRDALKRGIPSEPPGMDLLRYSIPASLGGVLTMYVIWVDRIMVGIFEPAQQVGFYQAASQTATVLGIVLSGLNMIFAPMAAHLYHSGEIDRLGTLYRTSAKWSLYLSFPLLLVLALEPASVLRLLFGGPFAAGAWALVILGAAQLVNAGTGPVGLLLIMTGHQRPWLVISALTLAANIGLNALLIPMWGILGAAVASAVAITGLFVAGVLQAARSLRIWPYDRRFVKGLVAAVPATAVVLAIGTLDLSSDLARVVLGLAGSTGAFWGVLALVGLDEEERGLMNMVRARITREPGPQ